MDGMQGRLRRLMDGAGWSVGAAAVLLLFALLAGLVVAQSPQIVLWTGQHATGYERGGLVFFRYSGRTYSVDVPGYGSASAVSVYFDPADPSTAMADNLADRAFTGGLVGGPVVAAALVLAIGLTRKRRWARRDARASGPRFGAGLDPEFVARQLEERRAAPRRDP
jgi:hypothetical protein